GRAELEGVGGVAPQPRARYRHPHRSRPAPGARGRVGAAGRRSGRGEPRGQRVPPAAGGGVRPAGGGAAALVGGPGGGVRALPARARRPPFGRRVGTGVLVVVAVLATFATNAGAGTARRCNGAARLCGRSLGTVAFATTHN